MDVSQCSPVKRATALMDISERSPITYRARHRVCRAYGCGQKRQRLLSKRAAVRTADPADADSKDHLFEPDRQALNIA